MDFFTYKEPNISYFSTKFGLRYQLVIIFLRNIITICLFVWGLLITSRSRSNWYDMFTLHGFLMILVAWCWLLFTSCAIFFLIKPEQRNKRELPFFITPFVAFSGFLIGTVLYLLIIIFIWIPYLPVDQVDVPVIKWGVPVILPVICAPTIFIIWRSILELKTFTEIIIDGKRTTINIKGISAIRENFDYCIDLSTNTNLVIMVYKKEVFFDKKQRWALLIENEEIIVRLYSAIDKKLVEKFTSDIVELTKLECVEESDRAPPDFLFIGTLKQSKTKENYN